MRKQLFVWMMAVVVLLPGCGAPQPVADDPAPKRAVAPRSGSTPGPGTVASADGVEIAYTAHRLDSPTLVLVHGWMCDQGYWGEQVPVLAEGFGVVTVDLAGHGASGTDRGQWTIGSLGDDVVAVVDQLGLERVIVVGHSMGGLVGLDVARKRPGTVIGVIGVDTLHDASISDDPAETEPLLAGMEAVFATTCGGFVRGMFVDGADPDLVETIIADMCGGPAKIGAALLRAYVDFDLGAAFAEAGVPIHVVNTDMWPTAVESNREVADFHCTILSGRSHFLMQDAPRELTRALIDAAIGITATR